MAGIQISGLLANQAFDWKSIVDQLITADSAPVTALNTTKTANSDQVTALDAVKTALQAVQDSVQSIRSGDLFSSRNVTSDTPGTTWVSNSANGAAIGAYTFDVQQLATQAQTNGAGDIGTSLSATTNVSGTTLANLNIATAVTAGTFTVNGQPVTVALTDSLADVFSKISTATGGDVTGGYDPGSDGIALTSASGELVLGAANDTSNFTLAMKLANNGTPTSSSASALGTAKLNSPLASAGLRGTIATLPAVAPGNFTVDGQSVTVAATDSLSDVFAKISTATGCDVTARFDSASDKVVFTSASGPLALGDPGDTSDFLSKLNLAANGTNTVGSSSALGSVDVNATLANAGNGAFNVNGVAISFNVNTDSLNTIIGRINGSSAGVNARYDAANDRMIVTNQNTGDTGIGLNESGAGLLAAIGLTTGATFAHGKNAHFTLNDGPLISSASNTLDSSVTGINGLSVTVNTQSTQTVTVASDTASMQSAIQDFLDKFNAAQDLIATDTKITVSAGAVSTAVLSDNREVGAWASQLQSLAFDAVSGLTGSVQRFDNLGIDFDSTSGHLTIKNQDALSTALTDKPDDVQAFFLTPNTGMVSKMFTFLTDAMGTDTSQQSDLTKANSDIDTQIATLQSRLDDERTQLTNSFIAMLDAQSSAQSQSTYLNSTFFNNSNNSSSGSCWVARLVYGAHNPRWLVFRQWLFLRAPGWFRALYLRHGERFAGWLADKPRLQALIRRWMDARITSLLPPAPSLN